MVGRGVRQLQLQNLYPRRTRRTTENGNGNIFLSTKGREELQLQRLHLLSAKGREGSRRTATAKPFCPRRTTKGREELQLQNLFPRRTRRATENGNCNTFYPRRAAKGHEGPRRRSRATPFCPRRAAKNCNGNTFCARRTRRAGDGGGDWCGRGEAWFWRGALRGRSPCTREGRRPDRTTAVVSG